MRYITDAEGYIKEISFGAMIECDGVSCVEYTGSVPLGYESIEDWYMAEMDTLYRWKIPDGNLTLDEDATAPEMEWVNPPMELGVVYRTAERYDGKPVYVCRFALELPNSSPGGSHEIASPISLYGARVLEQKVTVTDALETYVGVLPCFKFDGSLIASAYIQTGVSKTSVLLYLAEGNYIMWSAEMTVKYVPDYVG